MRHSQEWISDLTSVLSDWPQSKPHYGPVCRSSVSLHPSQPLSPHKHRFWEALLMFTVRTGSWFIVFSFPSYFHSKFEFSAEDKEPSHVVLFQRLLRPAVPLHLFDFTIPDKTPQPNSYFHFLSFIVLSLPVQFYH